LVSAISTLSTFSFIKAFCLSDRQSHIFKHLSISTNVFELSSAEH
jgi:hypothetical protein